MTNAETFRLKAHQYIEHFDVIKRLWWLRWWMRYLKLIWLHVWISSILLTTATNAIKSHAFLQHSHHKTLSKAASLTCFSSSFIYFTIIICWTCILNIAFITKRERERGRVDNTIILIWSNFISIIILFTLNCSLKKCFACFTTRNAIMETRCYITAY